MIIEKNDAKTELTVVPEGRLDTISAPQFEADLLDAMEESVTQLTIDFKDIVYISSAGLRVLLVAQKRMGKAGKMTIRHANENVMEVFRMTGFTKVLNIE